MTAEEFLKLRGGKEITREKINEAWEKYFKASGMIRGIGWVALYYDRKKSPEIFGRFFSK
jgi:hypothetical protein